MDNFTFIDRVAEIKSGESLAAFFTLDPTREFLKDHFADFPVMPGVLQVEALKQAASKLLNEKVADLKDYRLAQIGSVKYGQFVRPHSRLKIFVEKVKSEDDVYFFEGRIDLVENDKPIGRVLLADFSLVQAN